MQDLNYYFRIVEEAIAKIGVDPHKARTKTPGEWTLTKGKVHVWISIFYKESEKSTYFQVGSPVMKVPTVNREQFALELLELNNQLFGVAFTRNKENIYIKTLREAEGLDVSEAYAMILRVGNYTDTYDDLLQKKYPNRKPIGFHKKTAEVEW